MWLAIPDCGPKSVDFFFSYVKNVAGGGPTSAADPGSQMLGSDGLLCFVAGHIDAPFEYRSALLLSSPRGYRSNPAQCIANSNDIIRSMIISTVQQY